MSLQELVARPGLLYWRVGALVRFVEYGGKLEMLARVEVGPYLV